MKFNISKDWTMKRADLEEGQSVEAGCPSGIGLLEPRPHKARWLWRFGSALRVFWWKIRDAYHCRRKLGIGWRFAWQHAEAHVEQGWHHEMTPEQAAQEEAYAWAASR